MSSAQQTQDSRRRATAQAGPPRFASQQPTLAHVVPIRRAGKGDDIVAYQLLVDGGGAGNNA